MKGFKDAINGIKEAFATQVNFRFHFVAAMLVISAGFVMGISASEWVLIVFCIGFVIITELINTAIEYFVNFVSPEYHEKAGKIKDLSAGAVLVAALTAFVAGIIIFFPKVIAALQ